MPDWLRPGFITFTLGLLGSFSYLAGYSFDAAFLGQLRTTPEEVGLNQAALVIRAGVIGAVFVSTLLIVLVILVSVLVTFGRLGRVVLRWLDIDIGALRGAVTPAVRLLNRIFGRERVHIWSPGIAGRVKRRTWVISLVCAASMVALGKATEPGAFGSWQDLRTGANDSIASFLLLFAVFAAATGVLAQRRHILALLGALLVLLGLTVIGFSSLGDRAADQILTKPTDNLIGQLSAAALDVRFVCVDWASGRPPLVADQAHLYLGHANGVVLLADSGNVYRVRDSQIRDLSERRIYAGIPTCPEPQPVN